MNDLIILNARRIANLDWWHTLDMMGAVVQEGIYHMQFHGEDPAVFNLIMWYIGGSATDYEINDIGHLGRPRAEFLLDEVFPEAIGIIRDKMVALGVPIPYMHTVFEYQKGESYERWLQKKSQSNSP